MLGFLTAITSVVGRPAMEEAIRTSVPKGTDELNLGAFARGFVHGQLLLQERTGDDPDSGAGR
jgi:2-oxoglutarate ferredoxin oxidoreductase subunit gamma